MSELILSLTNLSGIKVSEIYQEELELEFQEKELNNKEKVEVNGIHWFSMSMSNHLMENLLKKLRFLLD